MSPIGNVGEAPEYVMVLFLIFTNFSRNNQAGGYRNNKLRDPSNSTTAKKMGANGGDRRM